MSALTAIEFGSDMCVLVKAAVSGADVRVDAVDTLDPAAFPGPGGFEAALRRLRRKLKLPRRARVVMWDLPDGASTADPAVAPLLAPLKNAGFRIDRVVSPCNALAALSRLRQPRHESAVAWLAINRANVAIAVVCPGELLFAHAFGWDSSIGATGSQARMLQRYSLVAFLAPELRRGIEAARAKGTRVDAIVTCGNLPDLRSLTMPLIEELDVEVETLDSLDGLTVKPSEKDTLTARAPAIRIACAGAVARASRRRGGSPRRSRRGGLLRAAALVLAIAGVGWLWLMGRGTAHKTPAPQGVPPTAVSGSVQPKAPAPPPPVNTAPSPALEKPTAALAPTKPPAKPQPVVVPPPVHPSAPAATAAKPAAAAPARPPAMAPRLDKADTSPAMAQPSTDPLPRITTILVSRERRFAVLEGGRVVSVGDTIGQRVVAAIEPRAVVLKEPSGLRIRVGLGGRLVGVDKGR